MAETKSSTTEKLSSFKKEQQTPSKSLSFNTKDTQSVSNKTSHSIISNKIQSDSSILNSDQSETSSKPNTEPSEPSLLWVDKYKPTSLKQIIGQTGDKSNAKKLLQWLTNWHKDQASGIKPVSTGKFFGGKGGSETGAGFKAALLSGPPGIGKTTTATLVCQVSTAAF
ncbi:hypothetical protein DPMN_102708 [Dreissena polymorpha]|uniref:ATPase AAA-type core domain-containing protein n=1 Tax=Dreissena polymorpha TaxID=45954 RepID=A0A9D4LLU0_DREPO|nr:hypothetical protein DPMN_102708 [Dreissena polymorpha]